MRDYVYDTENRLKSVAKDGVLLAGFNYDDSGERIAKTSGGKTRHFVYPFHEKEGSSETNYIYLNGQRVASIVNGQLKYIHADHLGSAQVVSNDSGATLETARYEPFGDFSGAVPTKSGNYYTGQYFDKETGLYYYGARYYNPRVGQFTTADTIVSNPALSQSFNRYSYVQNNPLNFTDPTGHVIVDLGEADLGEIIINPNQPEGNSALSQYSQFYYLCLPPFPLTDDEIGVLTSNGFSVGVHQYTFEQRVIGDVLSDRVSDFCEVNCQMLFPREWSTFDTVSMGVGGLTSFGATVTSNTARVFWSGGKQMSQVAMEFAEANGGKTLEMTLRGKYNIALDKVFGFARQRWLNASQDFAKNAKGVVHVFHENSVRIDSIWRQEFNILKNNSKVKEIIFHIMGKK